MKVVFLSRTDSGRSQIAYAFARREAIRREIETDVELVNGGTEPDDRINQTVVDAMKDRDLDLMGRLPRQIQDEDLQDADYIIGVGFEVEEAGDTDAAKQGWDIPSTGDRSIEGVKDICDRIEAQVQSFFDDIEADLDG